MKRVSFMDNTNKLINYKDINEIEKKVIDKFYGSYVSDSLLDLYNILGLNDLDYVSGEGCYIILKNQKRILDLTGGLGVLNLGHNHPLIKKVENFYNKNNQIDILKLGVSKQQAVLAHNLIQLMPKELNRCFFSTSGAEAVEAALKLVIKYQSNFGKKKIISLDNSYHGKTHGALSVTNSENYQDSFLLSIPKEFVLTTEFNNISSLEKIILENTDDDGKNDIAALILEPIQGQTVGIPDEGYLKEVQTLCTKNNILTIFDEIKVGMGRTGKLFSFMNENVIPDVVTVSKSLGGGKRAIGATITKDKIFKKAYGNRKNASLHTTTFGGIGETCAVAIESLRIISDNKFLDSVDEKGKYFRDELIKLSKSHTNLISDIRCKGLILGIEFKFPPTFESFGSNLIKTKNQFFISSIVRELYKKHNILCAFALSAPNTLELTPPLIIDKEQIDYFIFSLNDVLNKGFVKLGSNLVSGYLKSKINT